MRKQAMQKAAFRVSTITAAVAGALFATSAFAAISVKGVVAGSYFTAPVNSDSPALATPSNTVASTYAGAKVCFDLNDNAACDVGEPVTISKADGSFLLSSRTVAPLVAEISTAATNGGHAVTQRLVLRLPADGIVAPSVGVPASVAVTPLSTEVARIMEDDSSDFNAASQKLAGRLEMPVEDVLSDTNKVAAENLPDLLSESEVLTDRFGFAAKSQDRGDAGFATVKAAQQSAMNIEGIPRYDHIFVVMLENKATLSIKNTAYAPKIVSWLNRGNQFTTYFATGNPSEPNYTALGAADDFGITDDNQWNCGATGANATRDVEPTKTQPGLANSPFTSPCAQATNHNITGAPNLFNALTAHGMQWRTYSESMNPGQDFRTDSIADATVAAADHVYAPGTAGNNTTTIGDATNLLALPAGLYKTKHHPGMAYQNVRSAPEFKASNRTLGGGQWDSVLLNSTKYTVPQGYSLDQFGDDIQSGDVGQINFVVPDQCDDMHGIGVAGSKGTASDCSSVANNFGGTTGGAIITRGDNYVDGFMNRLTASPLWQNQNKRIAVVLMFDEGNATSGFNSCCGWNAGKLATTAPLKQNADGTFSRDTSVAGYGAGNRGHGNSIFGVITNQTNAPKGISDSDAYSHFSFVRTLQDMFGLADPAQPGSYMNRSKYTESFISANILNLPEFAGSADTHFDAVRPMNHQYVIPAAYTAKQSNDIATPAQVGPDGNQINVWALK
ncbi:MAG TPA: alkaline phosphatase family protein [Burkholderiales bacterium]